ncbi:DUF262 domain-containing protein [Proteiniclasticum ruminis]|uniref:Uncharacterized conserved protein, contains ParB-like and HNH nuclease domains n=1 Tax=Proteiniclasticum ruminis TaxID=398199 RepID=A0A1I5D9A8_9CLOT|nr:DUF262 domain-containing protein [Proteiniclasticum ruminis]SFN95783.1 Uncharacterized conserved protein, contains ParB-like and HNH nuclease domains [Proteiniclasticum ruminis]
METSFWKLLSNNDIVIPVIQRDYVHGRTSKKVSKVRENILNAMFKTIITSDVILELDFIYGFSEECEGSANKKFYPLDGQQRLTTLFLLHWFIAAKEGKLQESESVLRGFTYDVRHSSRVFCNGLVRYQPDWSGMTVSKGIMDASWFFAGWINDPTIHSMLIMLDAIEMKYEEYCKTDVWDRLISLENAPFVFHILYTDELNLPDELYIKMNSRGKELTEFEYFKIRFSELLPKNYTDEFIHKVDQEWSDLFWSMFKDNQTNDIAHEVDNGFIRVFNYITDILESKLNDVIEEEDYFIRYERVFRDHNNIDRLFSILDTLALYYKNGNILFQEFLYINEAEFVLEKTRIFFTSPTVNLLKKCASSYQPDSRINPFSLGEQILLYAFILQMESPTKEFGKKIRLIRNLIQKSEDTVRNENLGALLVSVEEIVKYGKVDQDTKFNKSQVEEENQKVSFISRFPQLQEEVFRLEDHDLLQGSISIFELTEKIAERGKVFRNVFEANCNFTPIILAMLTIGDYTQNAKWRTFLASNKRVTWRDLFTPSNRRGGFEKTRFVLMNLLDRLSDPDITIQSLIDEKKNSLYQRSGINWKWADYYINYSSFRYHWDGYYYWPDSNRTYECLMMNRTILSGKHWDPYLMAIKEQKTKFVSLGDYGQPLIYGNGKNTVIIRNSNEGFVFTGTNQDDIQLLDQLRLSGYLDEENILRIKQSKDGFDLENRIEKILRILDIVDHYIEV